MAKEPIQTPSGTDPKDLTPGGTNGQGNSPSNNPPNPDGLPGDGIDYKQKFSESKEEALRILHENERLAQENADLQAKLEKSNATPSDEELNRRFPNFDLLSDEEKEDKKIILSHEKELRGIKERLAWDDDFKKLSKKPEFASLKNKEEEFKEYAYKHPEVKDLELLAKSYFYRSGTEQVPPVPPVTRKGLEDGTGGSRDTRPNLKYTAEDAKRIRESNPKEYEKLIKSGALRHL